MQEGFGTIGAHNPVQRCFIQTFPGEDSHGLLPSVKARDQRCMKQRISSTGIFPSHFKRRFPQVINRRLNNQGMQRKQVTGTW